VNQHIRNSNDVNTSEDAGIWSPMFDSFNNSFDVITIYKGTQEEDKQSKNTTQYVLDTTLRKQKEIT
jgi:hypothetical protein